MFAWTKTSDRGSSCPINARIFIGLTEILLLTKLESFQKEDIKVLLFDLTKKLINATDSAKKVICEIEEIERRMSQRAQQKPETKCQIFESVLSLDQVEVFLKFSKDCLKNLSKIVGIIFDEEKFRMGNGNITAVLDKLKTKKELPKDSLMLKVLEIYEPWCKTLSALRDGSDHPKGIGSFLINYTLKSGNLKRPHFAKEFCDLKIITEDILVHDFLQASLKYFLPFCEMVILSSLFEYLPEEPEIAIIDIPEHERDPICPKRFRVTPAVKEDFL